MARRSTYLREIDPVPARTERHMLTLGFDLSRPYLDWCEAQGFKPSLEKSRADSQNEAEAHAAQVTAKAKTQRLR